MPGDFRLIDLRSQAPAVQGRLAGLPEADKLAWLAARGALTSLPDLRPQDGPARHLFESHLGFRCVFFFMGDALRFL